MRVLLAVFGALQLLFAVFLMVMSDHLVTVLVTPDFDKDVAESFEGVLAVGPLIASPVGEPFLYGLTLVRFPDENGQMNNIFQRISGSPEVTVIVLDGQRKITLPSEFSRYHLMRADRTRVSTLEGTNLSDSTTWRSLMGSDRSFAIVVQALRPGDRIGVEMNRKQSVHGIWFGGLQAKRDSLGGFDGGTHRGGYTFLLMTLTLLFAIGGVASILWGVSRT
ncbi:MAG: hypothetical protein HN348_21885 [Proteobacteria bacterium]|jgi:hypothetical protein|nr:hypothetical protein [Pseudomonadota bacterium]